MLALALALATPAAALTVRLHDGEAAGSQVRLGDVADFGGVSRAEADSLAAAVIGFAPPPGRTRVIPRDTIRMRIMQEGYLPYEIQVAGVDAPVVTRAAQAVTAEMVADAVAEALAPSLEPGLTLKVVRVAAVPMLPPGEVTIEVPVPERFDRTFFLTVTIRASGESARVNVTLQASRQAQVAVATRRLERGQAIQPGDVKLQTCDLYDMPRDAVTDLGAVVGAVMTRPIMPGVPISAQLVARETLVRSGQRVILKACIPGLEVTTAGTAVENGRMGEMIKVRNLESKRIITGRVTGAGEVRIVE